jgi:hypothetical protein
MAGRIRALDGGVPKRWRRAPLPAAILRERDGGGLQGVALVGVASALAFAGGIVLGRLRQAVADDGGRGAIDRTRMRELPYTVDSTVVMEDADVIEDANPIEEPSEPPLAAEVEGHAAAEPPHAEPPLPAAAPPPAPRAESLPHAEPPLPAAAPPAAARAESPLPAEDDWVEYTPVKPRPPQEPPPAVEPPAFEAAAMVEQPAAPPPAVTRPAPAQPPPVAPPRPPQPGHGPLIAPRTAWPPGSEQLPRCEIGWRAGYRTSYFRAQVREPGQRRRHTVAASPPFRWLLKDPADLPTPELAHAVRALAIELESQGWTRVPRGGRWFNLRFVRHHYTS